MIYETFQPVKYRCIGNYLRNQQTMISANILWMHPANERRRYNVTSSLIGWAHSQKWSLIIWLRDQGI